MVSDGAITFGQLLRRYRMAAGLTQEELAAQSAVAVRTISDLERGVSRRAHPSTVDQLAAALPLQPDELAALHSRGALFACVLRQERHLTTCRFSLRALLDVSARSRS